MASKSTFTRMDRIQKTVDKYAAERRRLKADGDYAGLARLPRDASPTRVRRMCALTGRTRGVYRKLGISRLMLRKLAHEGKIPGMRKSSW
jgi:small subunit ribosomal protein S14